MSSELYAKFGYQHESCAQADVRKGLHPLREKYLEWLKDMRFEHDVADSMGDWDLFLAGAWADYTRYNPEPTAQEFALWAGLKRPGEGVMNAGITKVLQWLRGHGFQTTDSGDGATGDHACDLGFPYVHIPVSPVSMVTEALRLKVALEGIGIDSQPLGPDSEVLRDVIIDIHWNPCSTHAVISLFNVDDALLSKKLGGAE